MNVLPENYRILPTAIDLRIRHFEKEYHVGDMVLALRDRDCREWFEEFVDRVVGAMGSSFVPICRMSDGEFLFALGYQPPSKRLSQIARLTKMARQLVIKLSLKGFRAFVNHSYFAGEYTRKQWLVAKQNYGKKIKEISTSGILALHFEYGATPFQEHYFPALKQWFTNNEIELTEKNYVPFYFVYAMLSGPSRERLIKGKRILLINGAERKKKESIITRLMLMGALSVHWLQISSSRSLYDRLDISNYVGKVDVCFVGAGVGKPNILVQLESLQVPCIDAGYMFEVWADSRAKRERPFCQPDEDLPNLVM